LFEFSSIEEYQVYLKEGKYSCAQAVEYYLDRIKNSSALNALIEVYADEALEKARQLDASRSAGNKTGKLHGVIIAIKDVICYKDHRVSAASNILKGFKAVFSSTAVERLLAEEAIIIGNLNCDEFAMGSTNEHSAHGKVLNALDRTKVPGGSSGGSAVAVQAGLCMVSLGTDTGGSVRLPASYCGIIGFKPGYGKISRYGLIAYASSFEGVGIFGNTISDIGLLMEVMSGPDDHDSTVSHSGALAYNQKLAIEKKFRFAYFGEAHSHPSLDPEIAGAVEQTIQELKQVGHTVEPVRFDLLDYIVPAYYILTTAEASSNLGRYDGVKYGHRSPLKQKDLISFYKLNRSEGFGKEVKRRIMLGTFVLSSGYYDAYFTKAQKVRMLLRNKINEIFNQYDFILMPTSTHTAPSLGENYGDPVAIYLTDIFTVVANLTGIPAISLPLYTHSNDMPFGLQIMSNRDNELSLLQVSQLMFKPPFVPKI